MEALGLNLEYFCHEALKDVSTILSPVLHLPGAKTCKRPWAVLDSTGVSSSF